MIHGFPPFGFGGLIASTCEGDEASKTIRSEYVKSSKAEMLRAFDVASKKDAISCAQMANRELLSCRSA